VVGFPGYQVSSLGNIRSYWTRGKNSHISNKWHLMKPQIDKKHTGYRKIMLKKKPKTIASLVCEAFHGVRPPNGQVCHKDGVRTNDAADNLRWGTQSSNEHDKIVYGTSWKSGQRKLSPKQAICIRQLYSSGTYTQQQIATKFGVHQSHISDIVNRKKWISTKGDI